MSVTLSIEVEDPVRVGHDFEVTVIVEVTSEQHLDGVTLTLYGDKTTFNDEGYVRFVETTSELIGDTTLAPGKHRLRAVCKLDADMPATCAGGGFFVSYHLIAEAQIPWWFNARESRPLAVTLPLAADRPAPRRATVMSGARGADALVLELSLDDTTFAPGEAITGAFSVGNIGQSRLDGASISVVAAPRSDGSGMTEATVFKSLVGVDEGAMVRFSLDIPRDAAPSGVTRVGTIAPIVLLRVDGSSVSCQIPITVGAYAAPAERDDDEAPELVGRVRWRFAWRDEGARQGLALEGRDLRLRGTLAGAVEVRVKPRGVGVAATLRWPTLGVDLRIEPRGLLPLSGVDLYEIDPTFSNRFTARGREEAQVRAACEADLCAALVAFDEGSLDDTGAKVASEAAARDPAALRGFLAKLERLAEVIVAVEARLPPPAWASAESVAAYRAFAEATGARFHPGRMALTGAVIDGDRAQIEARCDSAAPVEARVTLSLDPEIDREIPASAEAELLRAVPTAAQVEIKAAAITLVFPGSIADPASLRAPIAEAQRLARRLRGETARGPYR